MKVLFIVQGEGRGHLTQAISMRQLLTKAGHEVAAVLVGTSPGRVIPSFFTEQIQADVRSFLSPNLVYDVKKGGICVGKTVRTHLLRTPAYMASLRWIHEQVQEIEADILVNFYEVLGGLYKFMYRPATPMVCVAHQYLLLHPEFPFPKNSWLDRQLVNFNTRLTALGAKKKLALSFRKIPQHSSESLTVVPPLLRQAIKDLQPVVEDFVLVYMTHPGLSNQIREWHAKNPNISLHCFWDNPEAPDEWQVDNTLTFHRIHGPKYLRMMETCRALVTTAGFESVCEAMYLGKPVLMVPVPNHFEQACNAIDGVLSGAGASSSTFNLSILTDFLPYYQSPQAEFQAWAQESERVFIKQLEDVVETAQEESYASLEPQMVLQA